MAKTKTRKAWYSGPRSDGTWEVELLEREPEGNDPIEKKWKYAQGPYKTKAEALQAAQYVGSGSPIEVKGRKVEKKQDMKHAAAVADDAKWVHEGLQKDVHTVAGDERESNIKSEYEGITNTQLKTKAKNLKGNDNPAAADEIFDIEYELKRRAGKPRSFPKEDNERLTHIDAMYENENLSKTSRMEDMAGEKPLLSKIADAITPSGPTIDKLKAVLRGETDEDYEESERRHDAAEMQKEVASAVSDAIEEGDIGLELANEDRETRAWINDPKRTDKELLKALTEAEQETNAFNWSHRDDIEKQLKHRGVNSDAEEGSHGAFVDENEQWHKEMTDKYGEPAFIETGVRNETVLAEDMVTIADNLGVKVQDLKDELDGLDEDDENYGETIDGIIQEIQDRMDTAGIPNEMNGDAGVWYYYEGAMKKPIQKPKGKIKRTGGAKKGGAPQGKSKTSGWAKLKVTLPSSSAAKGRLAEGGHTPGYSKVLEKLAKYWERKGR